MVVCLSLAALVFGRVNKTVVGMTSSEGESFTFKTVVPVDGPVEEWMKGVEGEMRRTLASITKEGVWGYTKVARTKWIVDYLGMVTLSGSHIWWTWETEDTFQKVREGDKHAMKTYLAKLTHQLGDLTTMVSQWGGEPLLK